MDSRERLYYWLLTATKGGPTRLRLLALLERRPMNARQLSLAAGLDYKTVQHHLDRLYENGLIEVQGSGYGKAYFASDEFEAKKGFIEKITSRG
ncbi:MAG: winged helix-turn-helix domain-containing protein, partial [Candidatus Micrarchaeota archaeon]